MGHIFISYSRHDLEVVDQITGKMQEAGISVWIDREQIQAGKTWRAQIVQAIDTCDAFVLMLSTHSAASENVRKEMDLAQDSGRTLFIIKLDSEVNLPPAMRYQLVGLQWIDFQKLGLDKAVNQFIEILKQQPKASEEQPVRQVELLIKGIDPSVFGATKQNQLLDFIAELTQTARSEFQNVNLTPNHASVGMPARAAFELKTSALNQDNRLQQFGIKRLKLEGDKKYVTISVKTIGSTQSHLLPGDPTTDAPPPKKKK